MTSPAGLSPQDPDYRKALVAAACAGLASFNALYATQAVLPALVAFFRTSPSMAALTVSATTGALALAIIPLGALSHRIGRRPVLILSMLLAAALSFAVAASPNMESLIVLRFVQGLAVAGVPALMMTYLAEEIHPQHLPRIMGLYIAGTTIGGLSGRLISGMAVDHFGWRGAILASAIFALLMGILAAMLLPAQRHFTPQAPSMREELSILGQQWTSRKIAPLLVLPLVTMGAFVSLYNFLGFRLIDDFGFPSALASLVFLLYLSGTWASARAGRLAARLGMERALVSTVALCMLGLALLVLPTVAATIIGALLFTAAFFATHSLASTAVATRAGSHRAEASSLYVLHYYLGSALFGWLSGWFFAHGWLILVLWLLALTAIGLVVSLLAQQRNREEPGQ